MVSFVTVGRGRRGRQQRVCCKACAEPGYSTTAPLFPDSFTSKARNDPTCLILWLAFSVWQTGNALLGSKRVYCWRTIKFCNSSRVKMRLKVSKQKKLQAPVMFYRGSINQLSKLGSEQANWHAQTNNQRPSHFSNHGQMFIRRVEIASQGRFCNITIVFLRELIERTAIRLAVLPSPANSVASSSDIPNTRRKKNVVCIQGADDNLPPNSISRPFPALRLRRAYSSR